MGKGQQLVAKLAAWCSITWCGQLPRSAPNSAPGSHNTGWSALPAGAVDEASTSGSVQTVSQLYTCSGRKLPSPVGCLSQHAVVYRICTAGSMLVSNRVPRLLIAMGALQTAGTPSCLGRHVAVAHRISEARHHSAIGLTANLACLQRQLHGQAGAVTLESHSATQVAVLEQGSETRLQSRHAQCTAAKCTCAGSAPHDRRR
jgi:hypothetical protein